MLFYELSGCGFESRCIHLNFRYRFCFKQHVHCHSGNYRVSIHSKRIYDIKTQSTSVDKIGILTRKPLVISSQGVSCELSSSRTCHIKPRCFLWTKHLENLFSTKYIGPCCFKNTEKYECNVKILTNIKYWKISKYWGLSKSVLAFFGMIRQILLKLNKGLRFSSGWLALLPLSHTLWTTKSPQIMQRLLRVYWIFRMPLINDIAFSCNIAHVHQIVRNKHMKFRKYDIKNLKQPTLSLI